MLNIAQKIHLVNWACFFWHSRRIEQNAVVYRSANFVR